jgi:hypothetical protein
MMTSPTFPGFAQQDLEGRSVRDIVASNSGHVVDDAWCRKILRKILQSLELQYAMQMPHRAITVDTIVFHANGEPLLISDDIDAAPAPDAQLADDLTALAGVIHYAITQELAATGPLAGRVDGYSAALVATVDACMAPDPLQRPQSVDAVRHMLGMTAPGPLAGAVTLPASVSSLADAPTLVVPAATATASAFPPVDTPAPVASVMADPVDDGKPGIDAPLDAADKAQFASPRRGRRWGIAAGGAAIAIALVAVLFPEFREVGLPGQIALAPPQSDKAADPRVPAPDAAASVAAHAPVDIPAGSSASGASSGGTTGSGGGSDQPDVVTPVSPEPTIAAGNEAPRKPKAVTTTAAVPAKNNAGAESHPAVPPAAVPGHASYQLQIKPWGTVYVDGVERGVSPPLRRLALTPGHHTIRITHPHYRDSLLEFESASTTSNGKIIVDFNREAQ